MYEIKSSDYKTKTSCLFTNEMFREAVREWLSPREILSWLRPSSREIMVSTNAIIMCIIFDAWIQ